MTKNVTCGARTSAKFELCFHYLLSYYKVVRVSAFPALALAIALTYVIGDFFRPHLPQPISIMADIALCFVLYKVTNHYLRQLRE